MLFFCIVQLYMYNLQSSDSLMKKVIRLHDMVLVKQTKHTCIRVIKPQTHTYNLPERDRVRYQVTSSLQSNFYQVQLKRLSSLGSRRIHEPDFLVCSADQPLTSKWLDNLQGHPCPCEVMNVEEIYFCISKSAQDNYAVGRSKAETL